MQDIDIKWMARKVKTLISCAFFSNCSRLMFSFNYSTKQHMNYKTNKQRQAKTKKKTRVDFLILGVLQPLLK